MHNWSATNQFFVDTKLTVWRCKGERDWRSTQSSGVLCHARALPGFKSPDELPPFPINSSIIFFNQHYPPSNVPLISYRVRPFSHRMSHPAEVLIENPIECPIDPLSTFTSPSPSKFPKPQPNEGTSRIFSSQTASDQGGLGQAYPYC